MALSWAAINNDSVSLYRVPLHIHAQITTWAVSFFSLMNYSYNNISYHFSFLNYRILISLFFVVSVFGYRNKLLSLFLFLVYSSSQGTTASTQSSKLVSPLPFLFLLTNCLSASYVAGNALYTVINFLVIWLVLLNSNLVRV